MLDRDISTSNCERSFSRRSVLKGALACIANQHAGKLLSATKPPNIVLILADDVGYGDLSCYGATAVHTPQIDQLATTGLRFTNAHSVAATCTPSRYSLLTGRYAWRDQGVEILAGDARSLIQPGTTTLANTLQSAGYRTALVGKWHLGLGAGKIDWNKEIKPGPCELGFDEAFFFAGTADRVPTVYIRNRRVEGLDPSDPIEVSYEHPIGHEPTGKLHPEMLRYPLTEGHDGTIVDGISRMGWMTGGHAARWKDEAMADRFTSEACTFIEHSQARPFFLLFTPSDIHVPHWPAPEFEGKSACGLRCDALNQLDWSVGRILETLRRCGLEGNTMVIFSSDNGPIVNDGYDDGSDRSLGMHRPAGALRGGKYSIYEGGTRMPLLVSCPGHVRQGVQPALFSQVDLLRSVSALCGAKVSNEAAIDSQSLPDVLTGRSLQGRTSLIEAANVLAIRQGKWKLIDHTQKAAPPHCATEDFECSSTMARNKSHSRPEASAQSARRADPECELYDLDADPGESKDVAPLAPELTKLLREALRVERSRKTVRL